MVCLSLIWVTTLFHHIVPVLVWSRYRQLFKGSPSFSNRFRTKLVNQQKVFSLHFRKFGTECLTMWHTMILWYELVQTLLVTHPLWKISSRVYPTLQNTWLEVARCVLVVMTKICVILVEQSFNCHLCEF
jgi:hypothetical protein